MKRSTLIAAAMGTAALLGLVAWAFAPRPVEVEAAAAVMGPFETTVDEDARTRLAERYVVSAPLAARLARLTLREGDEVKAGDVVARLQPVLAPFLDERSQREQVARVAATEAGLRQSHERMEAARVALERARDELQRSEQLARAALGVSRSGGGAAAFELRAPVAGRVLKLHLRSEGTVAPGTPLLEIGDTAQLEVVAELLTADALQTAPGSRVRIERWGGPADLEGRVRRIEPAAFTKVSALGVEEQRVNVVIDITSPPAQWAALGDGYRVGVRIVTRSEPQALKVPVGAVFPLPAPATGHGVFVVDGGHARLQAVTLKARNGAEAWLGGGVAAGTRVVVYPGAGLADGAAVRAR